MRDRALAMVAPIQHGTEAYAACATAEELMAQLELMFQPAAESQMAKEQFKSCKQQRQENVSSYLSRKFAFYDRAYQPAERIFDNLLDEVIAGLYSNLVKRRLRWAEPTTREQIRERAILIVAQERRMFADGYGEATSYDGLAATTMTFRQGGLTDPEPMDIDKLDEDVQRMADGREKRCFHCNNVGHYARNCKIKKRERTNNSGGNNSGNKGGGAQSKEKSGEFRGKCNGCHQVGHMVRNCPNKGNAGRGRKVDPGKGSQRTPPRRVNKVEDDAEDQSFLEETIWEESE